MDWTVYDFYYALARLGGHQNRKRDHPPGWLVDRQTGFDGSSCIMDNRSDS
jgi:hypothetical protein